MKKKVIILGGGVAGMSAAHELAERGFAVEIYEMRSDYCGGKARSVDVPGSAAPGKKPLAGEHGFRFFPRFYSHMDDLLKRIPFPGNLNGVLGNLVDATRTEIARYEKKSIVILTRFPKGLEDMKDLLKSMYGADTDLTPNDIEFFANKLWQLATSCYDRRFSEYEKISWWDFIEAGKRSIAYRTFFATGLTRTLVAGDPKKCSTRTGGNKLLQLLFDMYTPGSGSDRLLNGPTNEVWLSPWLNHLTKSLGVEFHFNSRVESIQAGNGSIHSVTIEQNGKKNIISADYYIAALPVEVIANLLNPELEKCDPSLVNLKTLAGSVSRMHGIQFYLKEFNPLIPGHIMYMDTEWALTSVSQAQFWKKYPMESFGDGMVKDILSVDVSDWFTPGILFGKTAVNCTEEEVKKEVWAQLKKSLNTEGKERLRDDMLHSSFIEPGVFAPDTRWHELLLVNTVNSWQLRPEAVTAIPNFFLAGDYVRTNSDLASMESANEAARRAVNGILLHSGIHKELCRIWPHKEPNLFAPWRIYDQIRFRRGLPWKGRKLNWIDKVILFFQKIIGIILRRKTG